jgi:hypothetical protein
MSDTERIDRLEEGLALLLVERFGGQANLPDLRRAVRLGMRHLVPEVEQRVDAGLRSETRACQYIGRNVEEIRAFVDGRATVSIDDISSAIWLVQSGRSTRVRVGGWIADDPRDGRFYTTEESPLEEHDYAIR